LEIREKLRLVANPLDMN